MLTLYFFLFKAGERTKGINVMGAKEQSRMVARKYFPPRGSSECGMNYILVVCTIVVLLCSKNRIDKS